ncbi:LytTR family transcriptional regulator DNA-binding domain-containing protein [Dyadobacter sp. 32]|uniref:LytR/AlgR family response regulator transcription factor n=1 Tax=Dyadobacter sp. 32 TaxID=538966 RepID=UPI0011EC88E9
MAYQPTGSFLKTAVAGRYESPAGKICTAFSECRVICGIHKIICCESENNYTHFHLIDDQRPTVSKTLGDISEVLEGRRFFFAFTADMVSLNHIKKYVRGEGNYLVLSNDQTIPVARNHKEKLIERFGWF